MLSGETGKPRLASALALAKDAAAVALYVAGAAILFADRAWLIAVNVIWPTRTDADRRDNVTPLGRPPRGEVVHEVDAEDLRAHRAWN